MELPLTFWSLVGAGEEGEDAKEKAALVGCLSFDAGLDVGVMRGKADPR